MSVRNLVLSETRTAGDEPERGECEEEIIGLAGRFAHVLFGHLLVEECEQGG